MPIMNCFPAGGSETVQQLPTFTYTGTYSLLDDGDGNWRIKFLTSGTLTFTDANHTLDVFLVGGGGGGSKWTDGTFVGGGGGGYTNKQNGVIAEKDIGYPIVIAAGGVSGTANGNWGTAGGTSTAFSYQATGGTNGNGKGGGNGGSGGGGYPSGTGGIDGSNAITAGGTGQGTTTKAFADTNEEYAYSQVGRNRTNRGANSGDGGHATTNGGSGVVIVRNHRA